MSDSLSSADRDARIAEIEADIREEQSRDIGDHCGVFHIQDVAWLIAELRAALSREEEAKKDAERLDWLDAQEEDVTVDLATDGAGAVDFYSTIRVGWNQWARDDAKPLREVIDAARSVSLSENG